MKILEKTNLKALNKVKEQGRDKTIQTLKDKALTGRGGACFPTGLKWELTKKNDSDEKFVICNADEGEPGTFKDKLIMEQNPENLIEGIIIASYCINAKQAYIYLRGEYFYLKEKLQKVIDKILDKAEIDLKIDIIEGAGAYICGDETAIISSIQNKRGYPHYKPPYPGEKGLFDKPTVINNVETLANVPLALTDDNWTNDLRLFSVSGDVDNPGVYEFKIGTKLKEIADTAQAKNPKAIYFGAAGGCIPYKEDFTVSKDNVCKKEAMLGSCTLIFIGKDRNMLDIAINIQKFFKHESCGKCTPCREGNPHLLKLLKKLKDNKATDQDKKLLKELAQTISDTALCGLGQSCTNHLMTAMNFFGEDFK